MNTYIPKCNQRKLSWKLVDAEGWVLGRLATRVATILSGKDSPQFTPFLESGCGVIVINAEKVRLTGKKLQKKIYRHHTGYPGGLKEIRADRQMARHPERVVRDAVLGMLPKTKLGNRMAHHLRIYKGSVHPHAGQQPAPTRLEA